MAAELKPLSDILHLPASLVRHHEAMQRRHVEGEKSGGGGRITLPHQVRLAEGSVTMQHLIGAFNDAIQHHTSLHGSKRIENSIAAEKALGQYLGRNRKGQVKDILSSNGKLEKSAGLLPGGGGANLLGVALSPAYQEGRFNTCPNHAACKESCLGKTAGAYFYVGGGSDLSKFIGPRLSSLQKTQAMMRAPGAFAIKLHDEITAAKHDAYARGDHLGVRLNTLSDLDPRIHQSIIRGHPDVTFYDYTKLLHGPVADNHHYTYSSTGVSQPEQGIVNPNQNWHHMLSKLERGYNVAMPFSHKTHLPQELHDMESGNKYRVVDGTTHDFRPLNAQPKGAKGVIVGLTNRSVIDSHASSAKDSKGFITHFDPKEERDRHGKLIRGPSPGVHAKSGRPLLGDTRATNHVVVIHPQESRRGKVKPLRDNDSKEIGNG